MVNVLSKEHKTRSSPCFKFLEHIESGTKHFSSRISVIRVGLQKCSVQLVGQTRHTRELTSRLAEESPFLY